MSTVKVTTASNSTTEILGVSTNNPEFGYIRVESNDGLSFGNGGWLNAKSKSALIKGSGALSGLRQPLMMSTTHQYL